MNVEPAIWPKLSDSLTGEVHPQKCQCCGVSDDDLLLRHVVCDEYGQRTRVVVVLCEPCTDRLVPWHTRLHHELGHNEPWTGCMKICSDCKVRVGSVCTHPDLKLNGGAGLKITIAKPEVVYYDGEFDGRHVGWEDRRYSFAPKDCVGRETVDVV